MREGEARGGKGRRGEGREGKGTGGTLVLSVVADTLTVYSHAGLD